MVEGEVGEFTNILCGLKAFKRILRENNKRQVLRNIYISSLGSKSEAFWYELKAQSSIEVVYTVY